MPGEGSTEPREAATAATRATDDERATRDASPGARGSTRDGTREPFGEGATVDGKYRLARLLGKGGMGAVFEAQNLDTLKRCAVKLILDKHVGDEHHRARFFREARASSVADSEHIVQVFDCGTDPKHDVPYMVMELLAGESLHDVLERERMLDPEIAARIALQVAAGLSRAHEAGIVHRDIKPGNLFLTHSDLGDVVVKVLDFGIAKMRLDTAASLTITGATVGTPVYTSPEQALGHKTVDGAADVWSLGVVLYEMLTGTVPFEAPTAMALLLKVTTADVPLVQDRSPWVPPELAEIVHRCLARDRAQRYRDAAKLRDALESWVSDSRLTRESIARPSDAVRARTMPRLANASALARADHAAARRTHLLVAGGVAAIAVLSLAVPAYLASQRREPSTAALPVADASLPPPLVPAPVAIPERTFEVALPVGPAGVVVEIDGAPAEIVGGAVIVRGRPGDGRTVVLRDRRKRELVQEIVIRSNGTLIPDRLELSAAGIKQARASARQVEQAKRDEARLARSADGAAGVAGSVPAAPTPARHADAPSTPPAATAQPARAEPEAVEPTSAPQPARSPPAGPGPGTPSTPGSGGAQPANPAPANPEPAPEPPKSEPPRAEPARPQPPPKPPTEPEPDKDKLKLPKLPVTVPLQAPAGSHVLQ